MISIGNFENHLALGVHDNLAAVLIKERREGIFPLGHGELVADNQFWLHLNNDSISLPENLLKFHIFHSHLSICNQGFTVFPSAPDAPPMNCLEGDILEDHILCWFLNVDWLFWQSNQDNV